MKKFLSLIAALLCALAVAAGFCACKKESKSYKVYAPDGAPALSIVSLCGDSGRFDTEIVKADSITAYVTGQAPADFAVLPVNAAVKILGDGQKYKLLGTVTHGNLFLLKKPAGEQITAANVSALTGKTVGVINLANVPGLTFKIILKDNGLEYNELKDGVQKAADKVNLKNVAATEVLPTNAECDYFVVPEPAATTKINATGGKLSSSASLQTLYGGSGGYPQAVAVVKSEIAQNDRDAVNDFIASFAESKELLTGESFSAEGVVNCITSRLTEGLAPTFTAGNLNKTVITNCGISFVNASDSKADILQFMQKLNAVSANGWGTPQDAFFNV